MTFPTEWKNKKRSKPPTSRSSKSGRADTWSSGLGSWPVMREIKSQDIQNMSSSLWCVAWFWGTCPYILIRDLCRCRHETSFLNELFTPFRGVSHLQWGIATVTTSYWAIKLCITHFSRYFQIIHDECRIPISVLECPGPLLWKQGYPVNGGSEPLLNFDYSQIIFSGRNMPKQKVDTSFICKYLLPAQAATTQRQQHKDRFLWGSKGQNKWK